MVFAMKEQSIELQTKVKMLTDQLQNKDGELNNSMAHQQQQLEMLHENQKQYSLLESHFFEIKERYEEMRSERVQEVDKI